MVITAKALPFTSLFQERREKAKGKNHVPDSRLLLKNLHLQHIQQIWQNIITWLLILLTARWLENVITNLGIFPSQINQNLVSKEANRNKYLISNKMCIPHPLHMHPVFIALDIFIILTLIIYFPISLLFTFAIPSVFKSTSQIAPSL